MVCGLSAGCLPSDSIQPQRLWFSADTLDIQFVTSRGTADHGRVINAIRIEMLGATPVVVQERTFSGGPLGRRTERTVDRFPDLMPIHWTTVDSTTDLSVQFAPGYMQIAGHDHWGGQTRTVPRRHGERSVPNIELWIRSRDLDLGLDTVVPTYWPGTGTTRVVLSMLGRDTIQVGSIRRTAWLIGAEQQTPARPMTTWWVDMENRRILRQIIEGPMGSLEFTK